MPDKEVVQAVLEAVGVSGRGESRRNSRCEPESNLGNDREETMSEHSDDHGRKKCRRDVDCVTPDKVIYVIICNCVTINNGACEDWEFCEVEEECPGVDD